MAATRARRAVSTGSPGSVHAHVPGCSCSWCGPAELTATLTRRELEQRIVELARHWYHSGNEAELAGAVQAYEALLQRETKPGDPDPSA